MRSDWRAFTSSHQILFCLMLQLLIVALGTDEGLCKGGTNLHEPLPLYQTVVSVNRISLRSNDFDRCGRGRYGDHHIQKCHGPAELHH